MNYLKINIFLGLLLFFVACSSDDDHSAQNQDETEHLQLVKSFEQDGFTLDLFTSSGALEVGYNKVFFRIENPEGEYEENAQLSWSPLMTMHMDHHKMNDDDPMVHHHSCPYSEIIKSPNTSSLYQAFVVFIMPSSETDSWELKLDYTVSGIQKNLEAEVQVSSSETDYQKTFISTIGADDENYLLALVNPQKPKIGINPMEVAVFKQESEMDFPIVDHFKIKVDPRMPGMGNHSATGSQDLIQGNNGFYQGMVSFSMTGYWKINLILLDEEGEVLKGEPISEENPGSSIHFKVEF